MKEKRKKKTMIKNIIFDVYGTLICTGSGSVNATENIFRKYKLKDTSQDIYKKWKKLHKMNMKSEAFFVSEKEIFIRDLDMLFEEYGIKADARKEIKPMLDSLLGRMVYDDVEEVLSVLLRDYHVAIGSTTDTAPLMSNIEGTVLNDISNIFTSESLNVYKPEKRFYEIILEKTGWKAEETMFVGDSFDDDIEGPHSVGMKAVFINRKKITDGELLKLPDYVITSMDELLDIIKNENE